MKKVDLVFAPRLSSPNGDSRVVRAFLDSDAYFKSQAIDLSVISSDIFHEQDVDQSKKSFKKRLKIFLKKLIPYSSYFTVKYLKSAESKKEHIVDYYISNNSSEADILFFHEMSTCYHYLKKRKHTNAKIVLVIHSNGESFKMLNIYYPKLRNTNYYKHLLEQEQEVLSSVDKLGFVAKNAMEHFQNLNPSYDSNKLFYVYNGIGGIPKIKRTEQLAKLPAKYTFYCAGSITKRKGQELIIRAFNGLSEEEKLQFNITFLGDGAEKVKLENFVKVNKLDKHIFFKGFVNDVTSYLMQSNGFMLTSYDEGLPVAIIEALRLGLPIISTNVGGIPEMVEDKHNGFLIEPKEEEVFQTFKNLSQYNLDEMGENSQKMYEEKFTQNAMFRDYANIFLSLN
ncbi:glycosyltransferase family 4 protein [Winogradskyella sp. PG-2]|uniref:glycosyltransferase family 4 protein n=1 Tax=Winogradskyella sp. PG-2 TaxID=754409 RepID=UPI0005EE9622|nr:glycosyltransferase family 4 protein [Winogradskyella sp. PG-2]